ncbi:hypothetical protein ACQ5SO_05290 [Rhodovulum sp. DZ06]
MGLIVIGCFYALGLVIGRALGARRLRWSLGFGLGVPALGFAAMALGLWQGEIVLAVFMALAMVVAPLGLGLACGGALAWRRAAR